MKLSTAVCFFHRRKTVLVLVLSAFAVTLIGTTEASIRKTAEPPVERPYDPTKDEAPMDICRRNPTWKGPGGVDYSEECRQRTGWTANPTRDYWWQTNTEAAETWLNDGKDIEMEQCIQKAFLQAAAPKDVDKPPPEWTQ
jgi:hypothetical protein